jgi:hypothetical protein
MQRFIAELSNPIDQGQFEKEWQSDSGIDRRFTAGFTFRGRKVTIIIDSAPDSQWQSHDFQRSFSNTVRRLDRHCNIRWV